MRHQQPLKIRLIVATRESQEGFFKQTAMGRSLHLYRNLPIELELYAENSRGLPAIYNQALEKAEKSPAIMVFVHDDVYLCDFYWPEQILAGLRHFHVIGVAGNKRRLPKQPSWAFVNTKLEWDAKEYLSGVVGHGNGFPPANLSIYGPSRQEVKLLDGLLLAADSRTLNQHHLRFDEQFDFHFYDMDFCRQVEVAGLRMGTWSISVVHKSGGAYRTEAWRSAHTKYVQAWQE